MAERLHFWPRGRLTEHCLATSLPQDDNPGYCQRTLERYHQQNSLASRGATVYHFMVTSVLVFCFMPRDNRICLYQDGSSVITTLNLHSHV